MLSLTACSYRYPGSDRWAFRSIDLRVEPGEIVILRGRNGSGKTSLLKVIGGLLKPTEGQIIADEGTRPVYMDQSADEMLALDLTIGEHLNAFSIYRSSDGYAATRSLQEFQVGLDARLHEFVGHLSGGQRQIIALLATIESGANVLCLDEFLSALDTRSANVATELIRQLVDRQKVAVLAVSYSPLSLSFNREIHLDTSHASDEHAPRTGSQCLHE